MEQTVNTFSKGLQLDTHPMVQGNESLSDALNATMVTMNGNEVILQNDMGNRRVDHAYLPPGYTPVGIKEYGGIIYIAAYNPITNMSQVGSFPSPELYISSVDDGDLGCNVDFCDLLDTETESGNNYLKQDTILIPLSDENLLHIGDKFIILETSLGYIWGNKDYISNFKSNDKKLFNINIGILNSLNEFVDITDSLVYWNSDGNIVDSSSEDRFYIRPHVNNDSNNFSSIDDGKLEDTRENNFNIADANTYSYKLAGPLYLKASINHITNFSYNIYGSLSLTEGKYKLKVTAIFTSDIPPTNFPIFRMKFKDNLTSELRSSIPIWKNNFYEVTYEYDKIVANNNIISYEIDVNAILSETPNLCGNIGDINLEQFHDSGELDVNLFGTGNVELLSYRYYNNWDEISSDANGYLFINIRANPKENLVFSNLRAEFTRKIETSSETTVLTLVSDEFSWFKGNIPYSWSSLHLKPLELYTITIKYTDSEENQDVTIPETDNRHRFFLTTNLFNNCFLVLSEDFVLDFTDFTTISDADWNSKNDIIKKYLTIYPEITPIIEDNSGPEIKPIISPLVEYFPNDSNNNLFYKEFSTYRKLDIKAYPKLTIKNKVNYPKYLVSLIDFARDLITSPDKYKLSDMITSEKILGLNKLIEFYTGNRIDDNFITFDSSTGVLTYKDIYKGTKGSSVGVVINNCFSTARNYFYTVLELFLYKHKFYCGLSTDYTTENNNKQVLKVIWDSKNEKGNRSFSDHETTYPEYSNTSNNTTSMRIIHSIKASDYGTNNVLVHYDKIIETFGEVVPETSFLIWIFNEGLDGGSVNSQNLRFSNNARDYNSSENDTEYSRVWIRGKSDKWIILLNLICKGDVEGHEKQTNTVSNLTSTYLKGYINPINIVCCTKSLHETNFYKATNINYNQKYNLNLRLDYKFVIPEDYNIRPAWNNSYDFDDIINKTEKLNFKVNHDEITKEVPYFINILSNDNFLDEVLKTYTGTIYFNNVCKLIIDNNTLSTGNITKPNNTYKYIYQDEFGNPLSYEKNYYVDPLNPDILYTTISPLSGKSNIKTIHSSLFKLKNNDEILTDDNNNSFYKVIVDDDELINSSVNRDSDIMFYDDNNHTDIHGHTWYSLQLPILRNLNYDPNE